MNRETTIGIIVAVLLLGGMFLLMRRPVGVAGPLSASPARQLAAPGNMRFVAAQAEPPRYHNKETRKIKWNADGLPVEIEITRDYAVA